MLKSVEINVSEPMSCIYCGQRFNGHADLCLCLTQTIQEALTSESAALQQRALNEKERLEFGDCF